MKGINRKRNYLLFIFLFFLSGCTSLWGKPEELSTKLENSITPTSNQIMELQTTDYVPSSTPTIESSYNSIEPESEESGIIWVSEAVPSLLIEYIKNAGLSITNDWANSLYHYDIKIPLNDNDTTWVYVLVTPFPTIIDGINWSDLVAAWNGDFTGSIAEDPIWMDSRTLAALTGVLGQPSSPLIKTTNTDNILDLAWENQPAWGIIPFEDLQPRWKVISIDGNSPISNSFEMANYPLKASFNFSEIGVPDLVTFPASNRDPDKLTSLVMTGVTALVRATAGKMEKNGPLYPGIDIRNWLLSADLTHISNEIPFSDNCPFPDPNQETLVFCSDKKYISLLEDVGTDIVELTGNHFQDYGSAATYDTLEMYNQEGWIYFGGGEDLEDARSPKKIIHNGNKLAFIGCNPAGPQFAWATNFQPGASPCDFDWMHREISILTLEGFIPIVTFQYIESYSIHPLPEQVVDFRAMAAAGAVIISGSQAHLPQSMEFAGNSFIHYGLGNLFFDQMDYPVIGTRREFIDRHIFYDGKYIGTELLTAMLEDYSRPRPMTENERAIFLNDIFTASGW